ncbi:MAG: dihydrofolate reductase, partial [Acidobacteria bacterium]
MKWRVLVSAPYAMSHLDWYRQQLAAAGCEMVVANVRERLSEDELVPLISDVDGLICGDDSVTDRVLAAAPRLKVISKWGTGIDSLDQAAAARRGVAIRNTPNAFSEPVGDTVLGYALLFARQLDRMTADIRAGQWKKPQLVALREWTLGVIGVGNCGKAVVRRAAAFGMRVLGHDPVPVPAEFAAATGIEMVSLPDLLTQAHVVSCNTTLNPTSFHLMNDATIGQMRRGAFLINTSRGPVVEEAALVRALASGQLAGAALDVFEVEPLPASSRLREFPNCHLGPHNANSSPQAAQRV